jgi:hypothetical protein
LPLRGKAIFESEFGLSGPDHALPGAATTIG